MPPRLHERGEEEHLQLAQVKIALRVENVMSNAIGGDPTAGHALRWARNALDTEQL
jgi:hypothetical protein